MGGQSKKSVNQSKLGRLQHELRPGLLATTAWLGKRGYSRQLLDHYVSAGWLESMAHGVYRRPGSPLKWQHVVGSLQNLLELPVHVGGLSALEFQGYGHFARMSGIMTVHLYALAPLPAWLDKLPLKDKFVIHRGRLFDEEGRGLTSAAVDVARDAAQHTGPLRVGMKEIVWGEYDWPITYSTAERAMLEFLSEVPRTETIGHANLLMQGLRNLSPRRLTQLLAQCRSIKVKRLFFALAEHNHQPWLKELDKSKIDFGKGKRALTPGGKLHPEYLITLPHNIDDSV